MKPQHPVLCRNKPVTKQWIHTFSHTCGTGRFGFMDVETVIVVSKSRKIEGDGTKGGRCAKTQEPRRNKF